MVLTDLSRQLTAAISKLNAKGGVDKDAVKSVVKDVQLALMAADVNTTLVRKVRRRHCFRASSSPHPAPTSPSARLCARAGLAVLQNLPSPSPPPPLPLAADVFPPPRVVPQLGEEIKGKAMAALDDEEASGPAVARFVEKAVASSLVSMLVRRSHPRRHMPSHARSHVCVRACT